MLKNFLKITRKYTIYSTENGIIELFFRIKKQNNCKFVAESWFMTKFVDIHTHHPTGSAIEPVAVGIHPWDVSSHSVAEIEPLIAGADIVGEIGLDSVCEVDFEQQLSVFHEQLALAEKFDKPVVIHCVRTFEQVMNELKKHSLRAVIFHGFIGSPEQAKRAIERGYFLSFGERSFRSPKSIESLRITPLDQLFLETDDSPTSIQSIYTQASEILGITTESLSINILENYHTLSLQYDSLARTNRTTFR